MGKRDEVNMGTAMIRSSAAEYLTFVAGVGDQEQSVEMRYEDENLWATQKMIAELYGVSVPTINEHIARVFSDGELSEQGTIRDFRIVQNEGSRQVTRELKHYSLQMIMAVGFKVNSDRAIQFRRWVSQITKDYTIQGWIMDIDRLKDGHLFSHDFFDRQLAVIREIRLSERMFYQKVTDLYATAFDYDKDAKATRDFFKVVQNKMHWAVHRHTAAELIVERANANQESMGLTHWKSSPDGKIVKTDVSVAKNYLSSDELNYLQRIVSLYLDYGEMQAERKIPMSMEDWTRRLDGFLEFNGNEILTGPGKVAHEEAKLYAESEFEKYRIVQDELFESDFDRFASLEKLLDV
ncbi:MAG: virulence RhuM family protein [Coriobacteriia bacterium]|nr:virulence RhuM family protein [Coriobacteriia bacterium]